LHWLVLIKTANESIFPFNVLDSLFKYHMTKTMVMLAYIAVAISRQTGGVHQTRVYQTVQKNLEYFELKARDRQLKRLSS
jgi:hypothetical protein